MSSSYVNGLLFAQVSRWQRLGDGLHSSRNRVELEQFLPFIVLAAIAVVGLIVFMKIRKRNDMTERCNDPAKLFREVSLAHQLDHASQKLLWKLAESAQLQQPVEVFLRPSIYAAQLPADLREQEAAYQELHQRLFR